MQLVEMVKNPPQFERLARTAFCTFQMFELF
jgi:GMP synthase-like glutamine amidotransferase